VFEPKELVFEFAEKLLPKVEVFVEGLPKELVLLLPKVEVFELLFPKVVPPPKPPVFELLLLPNEPKALEEFWFCPPKPKAPVFDGVDVLPKEKEFPELLLFDPKVLARAFGVDVAPKENPPPLEGVELKALPKLNDIIN
jgi:hypothetical protein